MQANISHITVIKSSGNAEPFSLAKYRRSLERIGVDRKYMNSIVDSITHKLYDGITTRELYQYTLELLVHYKPRFAHKYSLKEALRLLGPTGYPFEKLVARILIKQGYHATVSQMMQGACVTHEIDVLAHRDSVYTMVECKFHNEAGVKSDIQTTLYVKARFEDLKTTNRYAIEYCMLVTNTKFTSQAVQYASCQNITLLAWGYPADQGIETLIDTYHLYPITALIELSQADKTVLLNGGFILCTDVLEHKNKLQTLGLSENVIKLLLTHCKVLCEV